MSLRDQPVTVLGAGVAGLALSRSLALRGAKVTLLDQTDSIGDFGAGLQISPNGVAVLRALGLGPVLEAASVRAQAVELRCGLSGALVTRLDMARLRPDQGWHFLHRADLVGLLLDGARAAGVELRLLQKVASVDLTGPRPKALMATGAEHEASLMIGADGLHSPMRAALNGAGPAVFTGQVAWRMILPCEAGAAPVAEVHMGPGRHLVSYPLRGGAFRNIVAVEERRQWVEEGWSHRDDPQELRRAFKTFGPRVRGWLDQVQDVWLWGLFRHPVARHWHRTLPQGTAAILGDAAHPTLPFLAQGANMALEDAWTLAQALDQGSDLASWSATRHPRTARITEAANRNARAYHLKGPIRPLAHAALRLGSKLAPSAALSRFDWIYQHDVTRG